ncbi:MAG: hypothetical protein ACRDBL_09020 [Rhabdaerophilum sp.]
MAKSPAPPKPTYEPDALYAVSMTRAVSMDDGRLVPQRDYTMTGARVAAIVALHGEDALVATPVAPESA